MSSTKRTSESQESNFGEEPTAITYCPSDYQQAEEAQHEATQKYNSLMDEKDTRDTSLAYKMEMENEQNTQRVRMPDLIYILPTDILYDIFGRMDFYDFATCLQVCIAWQVALMRSVWPQLQQYFFSAYPLACLDPYERETLAEWMMMNNRHIHEQQSYGLKQLLRHFKAYHHNIVLTGKTKNIIPAIQRRSGTLKALVINSKISRYSFKELFKCLGRCYELRELSFNCTLETRYRTALTRQIPITSLCLNNLDSMVPTTHIALLRKVLLCTPFLQELVLEPQAYWKGKLRQILQVCPSSLSVFAFAKDTNSLISHYESKWSGRSIRKFITVISSDFVDLWDLQDTIQNTTKTLEVICFSLLQPPYQTWAESNYDTSSFRFLTDSFRRCHRLHTIDIFWGNKDIADDLLKSLSSLPNLKTVYFTLASLPQELRPAIQSFVELFDTTNAPIKRIGLYGFNEIVEDSFLRTLSKFSALEYLKITASTCLARPNAKNLFSNEAIQELVDSNPKLKLIDTGTSLGIYLSTGVDDSH